MYAHGEHIVLFALGYGFFLHLTFSIFSQMMFRHRIEAMREGRRAAPYRWSHIPSVIAAVTLPLFGLSLQFIR